MACAETDDSRLTVLFAVAQLPEWEHRGRTVGGIKRSNTPMICGPSQCLSQNEPIPGGGTYGPSVESLSPDKIQPGTVTE